VVQPFTTEEVSQIKGLIAETRQTSNWKKFALGLEKFTTNNLLLLIVGFLLTGWVGARLSNKYTTQQQELAAIRSFSDELNKLRIQKVGEVWERLDEDEFAIDQLLKAEGNNGNLSADDKVAEVTKHIQSSRALVSKYRFWLGKKIFDTANEYLNANVRYSIRKLTGSPEDELQKYLEKRNAAKSDIEQVREQFLLGRGSV